jgi:hypothetical protein
MVMKASNPPRTLRLVDTMRAHLSDRALSVLESLDMRRDLSQTVAPKKLREMLIARRWPVNESALKIEGLAGGLEVAPNVYLGPYAAIRESDEQRARTAREAPEVLKSYEHLREKPDASYSLVRPHDDHVVYVAEDGAIGLANIVHLDEDKVTANLADSFVQYIEVAALARDSMLWPFDGTDPLRWHRIWLDSPVGAAIAAGIGGASFEPGTGIACSTWVRDGLHVVERRSAHFFNDTTIGTPDTPDAVAAVRVALSAHDDLLWVAPAGTVSGAMLATVPRCGRGGGAGFDVFAWGQPRGYFPRRRRTDLRWPA